MKKRYHFFIVMGVLLIGLIIGSFLDLQINQALFFKDNAFGIGMAAFGVYPAYMGLSFAGGTLFLVAIKRRKDMPVYGLILCFFFAFLALGMATYLCGEEFASPNGFNNHDIAWIGYLISGIVMVATFVGAYFLLRNGDMKVLLSMAVIMIVIFTVALLPPGFIIKLIIHRPRYRYAVRCELTSFYNWWQTYPEYKTQIGKVVEGFEITKEEFKSFPSGHSGTGAIMMMFLPYLSMAFKKLKGKETLFFYIGFVWMIIMMFSRITVGAHYLTDTCMGSLIVIVVYYVANEVALKKKLFDEKEESEIQEE